MAIQSPIFKELPIEQIEHDIGHLIMDFPATTQEEWLLNSIRSIGIQVPIAVMEIDKDRYTIIDGHRRAICPERAEQKTVPSLVYHTLSDSEFYTLRFELQDNFRPLTQSERARQLKRIKDHLPGTAV